MKILVTGVKGQLGSEIKFLTKKTNDEYVFVDQDELDLSKIDAVVPFLQLINPDFIINCAAYTAVDKAEDEPILAEKINALAPREMASYCLEHDKRLIHISTDYVFDGNFDRPITEEDTPNPQSVYGKTKLEGENFILELLDNAYIIRTAWVYSAFGNNFVKTMLRLGTERDEINVVADQYGSPTYARDLAKLILTIIENIQIGNEQPGIYHYSNEGEISWKDFAMEIIKLADKNCKVNPVTTDQYPTRAVRPKYSVLSKSKIKDKFNIQTLPWQGSLSICLTEILKEK